MSGSAHWSARPFTCVGGALCLDFANTAAGRMSETPMERLTEPEAIVAFAAQTRLCAAEDRGVLLSALDRKPGAVTEFIALREAIYRTMQCVANGRTPEDCDLRRIEYTHRLALSAARLWLIDGRPVWDVPVAADGGLRIVGAVMRSVLDVLADADFRRLRFCPRGNCGFVFLDSSKAGRRRWCDMEVCGNRAKADRFARRRKSA